MNKTYKVPIFASLALLMSFAAAGATNSTYNWDDGGAIWGVTYPKCEKQYTVQSPVDFKFDWLSYSEGTNYYLHDWESVTFIFYPSLPHFMLIRVTMASSTGFTK